MRLILLFASILFVLGSAQGQIADLEPYDAFELTCAEASILNSMVTIDGMGVAALPLETRLVLAGMPIEVAAQRIRDHFEAKLGLFALRIRLSPVSGGSAPVRFSGAIQKPGNAYPSSGLRLADILARGEPTELADLEAVVLHREGKSTTLRIDPSDPDGGWNIELRGGDRIRFPTFSGPLNVFVLGAVVNPGSVSYRRGLTVRQALELAGGAKPSGDIRKVDVLRNDVRLGSLDLTLSDQPLRPGDAIRIPALADLPTILIIGGVKKPGRFAFRDGLTLYAAVQEAGGLAAGVKLGKVKVVRLVDGRSIGQTHDLGEIVNGRAPNPALRAGDRIEIAEPPR